MTILSAVLVALALSFVGNALTARSTYRLARIAAERVR